MVNRVRRALVSVYDKEGIVEFCKTLTTLDIEIVSSGGTARSLEENGIKVTRVSDYTGFPEMLDGRVKTLHPRIHGGLLAIRSKADHMADLERNDIQPIDLVVVNLYPFEKTVAAGGTLDEVIEEAHLAPEQILEGIERFARDREARLSRLRQAVEAAEKHG